MTLRVRIDGEVTEFDSITDTGWDQMVMGSIGRCEYYLSASSESAGEAAREYWEEMAKNDSKEFVCMVGEKNLVEWALGRSAGPGSTQVRSLEEWLDLWLDIPEEQWASYDSAECAVTLDYEDYMEEADRLLEEERTEKYYPETSWPYITEEEKIKKATELMEEAEQEFRDEWGFFPTVAYRHN